MPGPFRLRPGPAGDLCVVRQRHEPRARPSAATSCSATTCRGPRARPPTSPLTYPALADRLTRESGWRVVTAALRGAGESAGDFSALGWLDDLTFLAETEIPETAPRLVVGFGFGGVLALHLAARDERVAGVACLGTPADLVAAGGATPRTSWPAAGAPA